VQVACVQSPGGLAQHHMHLLVRDRAVIDASGYDEELAFFQRDTAVSKLYWVLSNRFPEK